MAFDLTGLNAAGKQFFSELEKLAKLELRVGFQDGENTPGGASVAEIAAYNELGTSTIPSRPFLRQSFENHEEEIQNACNEAVESVKDGSTAQAALDPLGAYLKGLVQEEILDGGFEPNAESTIRNKGSDTPLVDTGQMRQSVNYIIAGRST